VVRDGLEVLYGGGEAELVACRRVLVNNYSVKFPFALRNKQIDVLLISASPSKEESK
jgi:hypothetical protein